MNKLVFLLWIAWICLSASSEAKPFQLDPTQGQVNLSSYLEYSLTSDNPEQPPVEGWSSYDSDIVKLGFDNRVHWFRLQISNTNHTPLYSYLEIGYPLLNELNIFLVIDGEVTTSQRLGDQQPFSLRPVQHETYIVPLSVLSQQDVEIYFSVRSEGLIQFPITLWQKEAFQATNNIKRLFNGVLIGIAMSAVIGCVLLSLFRRELTPLFDAGLILSLLLLTITINGLGFHYLWPELPKMQQHAIYLFSCCGIFFSAVLARIYLHRLHDDTSHWLFKAFGVIAIFAIILSPLTFVLTYQTALYAIVTIAIAIGHTHFYASVWAWRKGLHEHQEVNLGLITLLVVLVLVSVNNFTAINFPLSNLELLQICLFLLVFFVALSLLKKEQATSWASNVLSADDEDELQLELANRNFELETALRELQEKNSELEKLNTLDALTGIHNRRHFDKRLSAELRRARRELSQLSLVMFDIDHFKSVNDTYGHIAGDEVIREVAETAASLLNRTADAAFRYGGEEFALLMPSTDLEGATNIAEKLRKQVESLSITSNSQPIKCTISLGVASYDARQNISPEQYIEQADSALYKAKQSGRNQVQVFQSEDS